MDSGAVTTQDADTITGADSATHDFEGSFSVAANGFDSDGDGGTAWSYALALTEDGEDSGLTSAGATVYLYMVGAAVIGSTDSAGRVDTTNTVFDLSVSGSSVTLQQHSPIDHELPGVGSNFANQVATLGNDLILLNATAVLTDGDGDTASAATPLDLGGNIVFNDDGPSVFEPDSITLINSGTASGTDDLRALGSVGADVPGTLVFVDGYFADDFLRTVDNTTILQSGGENIVLSGFNTTTLTAATVSGLTVFTATLNAGDDQYTINFERAINDGAHVSLMGAAPVKSGNPTYNIINNVSGTTLDLLFSGGDTNWGLPSAHSVNVSTNGAGVDNQSMNASAGKGETLRIDFTSDASLAGSPLGKDFNLGTQQTVNGYSFMITQNTPTGTTATVYIQTFDANTDKVLVGDAGDIVVPITEVKVGDFVLYDGTTMYSTTVDGSLVQGFVYGNGIVITGLNEGASGDGVGGDDPVIKVSTANGFDRVEVSNFAGQIVGGNVLGGTGFDMAPAGIDLAVAGDPVGFALPVQLVDFDGDYSPVAVIGVNLMPVPV